MQIKHTFLFTLILGLVWTGYLFAYILGPDPGVNGVFNSTQTCNMSGCHTGNPVNANGGSTTLGGLPSAGWVPGQTYPLTVTVARTGQHLFGFQLSAVADATNQQAGSMAPQDPSRVKVICGGGTLQTSMLLVSCSAAGAIQYAEHQDARTVTNTYTVNWTAPASASTGVVRFNFAGNAANGDITNQGDFIYISSAKLGPAAVQVDLSVKAFTMVDRGGTSFITDGGTSATTVGYSRIQPAAGSTTPAGVAIFGFRQGNTLVTEAGVPASLPLRSVRTYAEVTSSVNTGVAIANPNDQPANITFFFTDSSTGLDLGQSTMTIEPHQQLAKFLSESPFNVLVGRTSFQGAFTFTSDIPVSVIALRGFLNERTPPEFLITTLPISDLSATPGNGTVYLPHFADGGGWTTQIALVNPTDSPITGTIQFFSQGTATAAGAPVTITANGQTAQTFNYSIPGKSSFKLTTSGASGATQAGSVRVTPSTGAAPASLVVFTFKLGGITLSEAGVPGIQGSTFRMYVEENTPVAGVGAIQTGFAIANVAPTAATVNLELSNLSGAAVSGVVPVVVPGNGQIAKFLHELFPGISFPFKGVLRISGGGTGGMSIVGLRGRYNERGDFLITTTPPTNEAIPASGAEALFPHLVNGGGYTTQFILFSGAGGQASSGNLKFIGQDGNPLSLNVN